MNQSPKDGRFDSAAGGMDVFQYVRILRRRFLYLIIPFVLVLAIGTTVVILLRPVYVAEGKILVESQQIPTELVRPTVTGSAKERIQVIEQRVMTRENLLAIVEKFRMFPDARQNLSGTQVLDLMRQRTNLRAVELDQRRRDQLTIALTVSFEYEQPDVAMRVANEIITLILNEDARNRTSRAQETTNFLAREVKKLEVELGAIDAQIADFKRRYTRDAASEKSAIALGALRAEIQEKSSIYADAHPEMVRLKRQAGALEKLAAQASSYDNGLDALQNQRAAIQKNLEAASQKASAARLGESLEHAQFSERLEVLEQAVMPQKPTKPNRPKLLMFVFALASGAGLGLVALLESFSKTIWGPRDLYGITNAYLVVGIPYIATKKELLQRRIRALFGIGAVSATVLAAGVAAHVFVRPLDQIWSVFLVRLMG